MNDVPPINSINPELAAISDFLRDCLPFDELPLALFRQATAKIHVVYFCKGHVFQGESDEAGLRLIRSGAIELRGEDGQLVDRLGEGESFNLKGLRREQPNLSAVLIEDSLIYLLKEEDYQTLRGGNRDFDRFFHSQRDRRIRRAARNHQNPSPLLRSVSDVMTRDVLTLKPQDSIQLAAQKMSDRRVSSALIADGGELKGILTDRDLRSRAVAKGVDLQLPVSDVMTLQPKTISPDDTLFDTTLFMSRSGFHHMPVREASGEVVGIVTSSDLMLARQDDPVFMVQHISRQQTLEGLQKIAQSLPNLLVQWVNMGIRAQQISHLLTAVSDAITCNLITQFLHKNGDPPVGFCWLGFGSQGRGEQLLGADQDNGLLIADDVTPKQLDWFKALSHFVCDGLNACGYVYCPGEVMATTDSWRQPLKQWKKTIDAWTSEPTSDALMHVSIFFDLRSIYGDESLANKLQAYMLEKASASSIFLARLAENVLESKPPLGIFRQFVVDHNGEHKDELNLKKAGVMPIVDIARIFALANKRSAVNTTERFAALKNVKALSIGSLRNLQDALSFIMQVRIEQQAKQISEGQSPSNWLNPDDLTRVVRRQLKDAFTVVDDGLLAVKMGFRSGVG
ncbi:MAG: CBS domain-containing protein [Cellvibrionaceae bacterium]